MKISLNWIREFVDIPAKYSSKQLADLLTLRTCEVESIEEQGKGLGGVVIGEMLEFSKHPNAEKLNVAKVDIGRREPLNLIFGQMVNMNIGDRIPVAIAPTVLPTGMKIEAKELRGVRSEGMLCLEQELGFKEEGVSLLYFPKTKPGTPLAEALGLDDTILEIDNKSITHRPDLWGIYGMAREFTAFLGLPLKKYEEVAALEKVKFPAKGLQVKVKIQTKDIAPRFCAAIMTGVKIAESPAWLKNRLTACGVRPVNNVVDVTNYVMLELGQPMHAFDRALVATDTLAVRYAENGEMIETLDHKKRRLGKDDAVISNGQQTLGLAGIMGGLNSEIFGETSEIIFEAANWNSVMIRKTAQRHGLRSDAAQRFEKSLDPTMCDIAVKRACALLCEICPSAKIAGPLTDVYLEKPKPISITIATETIISKIGASVSEKEAVAHLKALEFGVSLRGGRRPTKQSSLKITVPSFRATKDVNIEDDIVEEVARMYGYEKIIPALPDLPIRLPHPNRERSFKHLCRDILSRSLGFTETLHYSFYGKSEIEKCMLPEDIHVRLSNPLTDDQTHLRITLLPHMLKSVAQNLKFIETFKLYEVGRTYIKSKEFFPREEKFICGIVVGPAKEIFYDALGALQSFFALTNAPKTRIEKTGNPPSYAHPSKWALLKSGNADIAIAYEVHPQILKNFGIESNVAAFEINFSHLAALGQEVPAYKPLPKFPGIGIDVSILVTKKTTVREVRELIRRTNTSLIANLLLIDIFEDEKALGEGKKSFTFRVLLQSPDRTLTDEEMKQVQEKIFQTVQSVGFTVRGE